MSQKATWSQFQKRNSLEHVYDETVDALLLQDAYIIKALREL